MCCDQPLFTFTGCPSVVLGFSSVNRFPVTLFTGMLLFIASCPAFRVLLLQIGEGGKAFL